MSKYIVGLIIIAVAMVMILKTEWFLSIFGRIAWAEEKLGTEGGTRIFYKILGISGIIIAFMLMSGCIESGLERIFVR